MNINLLIDAIVRQTVILIAQLATTAGARAPLAHVANEVFLSLVTELKEQGVGQKVIADMFGLALRTYHNKVRRLSESVTDRGRSLWEAVLGYIIDEDLVSRADVMRRFSRDDEMTVRGVLNDLVETGLVFRTGRGDRTAYRAAAQDELGRVIQSDPAETAATMVWVAVHRLQPATRAELLKLVPMPEDALDEALARLTGDARIEVEAGNSAEDAEPRYTCDQCVISYDNAVGWEAAVFDHYQAMVTSICTKLDKGATRALPQDAVGGSTYGFDVFEGHPLEDEVLAFLRRVRQEASELRNRVDGHNAGIDLEQVSARRVIFYAGQTVLAEQSLTEGGNG